VAKRIIYAKYIIVNVNVLRTESSRVREDKEGI